MNIAHISTVKTWRGGEQQLAYLFEQLQKKNEKQLIVCSEGSALQNKCEREKWNHIALQKRWNTDFIYAFQLSKILKKIDADVVHTHDAAAHTLALISKIVFGYKAKLVVSRRVDFSVGKNIFSSVKYNHAAVSKIICVSNAIKNIMLQSVPEKKLAVVHSGVDLNKFKTPQDILRKELNIPHETLLIANIAALAPHKDYFTFLETVKILKEQYQLNAKYLIIGDGALKEKIEQKIIELQLQNDVWLTGFRNDIAYIFPELDLLLFTSETEGLGTTVLDAFSCGVPVVATDAGGVAELVLHEKTGLLAPVKNSAQLAAHVWRVVTDKTLKNQLTSNAKNHLQSFSKEAMAEKTLKEYLGLN